MVSSWSGRVAMGPRVEPMRPQQPAGSATVVWSWASLHDTLDKLSLIVVLLLPSDEKPNIGPRRVRIVGGSHPSATRDRVQARGIAPRRTRSRAAGGRKRRASRSGCSASTPDGSACRDGQLRGRIARRRDATIRVAPRGSDDPRPYAVTWRTGRGFFVAPQSLSPALRALTRDGARAEEASPVRRSRLHREVAGRCSARPEGHAMSLALSGAFMPSHADLSPTAVPCPGTPMPRRAAAARPHTPAPGAHGITTLRLRSEGPSRIPARR
jgi:hypothetical protein